MSHSNRDKGLHQDQEYRARDLHRDLQLRLPGPQGRQGLVSSSRLAPGQGLGADTELGPSEESEQGLALCSIALGLAGITQRLEPQQGQGLGQQQGQGLGHGTGTENGLEPGKGLVQPVSVLPAYFARQLLLASYRFVTQVTYHTPLYSLYILYMLRPPYVHYMYRTVCTTDHIYTM